MDHNKLFIDRAACLLYNATTVFDEKYAGWIGGNPPEVCMNSVHVDSLDGYRFYFTFILPGTEQQFSVFLPDFDVYLVNDIYPTCAIKVIEHTLSQEGDKAEFRMEELNKHFISFYRETDNDNTEPVDKEKHFLIKLGGIPELIQNKLRYTKPAEEDGYSFLMQIDEYGYPDELLDGSAPFGFGSLYLYAKQEGKEIKNIIAAFWQGD